MSVAQEKFERTGPWAEVLTKGAVKVKSFEKVDALMKEVVGVKSYTLSYKAEMECVTPVMVIEFSDDDRYLVYPDDTEHEEYKRDMKGSYWVAKGVFVKELKPGDMDTRTGSLELTLFENGWK